MMVPAEKWERLKNYYKGAVSSNALLDKVGKLGATEHVILEDRSIPDSMAVKIIQPLMRSRRNLTKRLKTGASGASNTYGVTAEEPEAMVDTPAEALVKRLIKGQQTPATPLVHPPGTPGPSNLQMTRAKRELPTTPRRARTPHPTQLPVPTPKKKTPSSSKPPLPTPKKTSLGKSMIKGGIRGLSRSVGLNLPDDDDIDPQGSALTRKQKQQTKRPAKRRQQEWEKLDVEQPARQRLSYGTGKKKSWENY